ncbi:MAG: type IV toxin-antitoxin system AbiEi family antitoxin domain-containing protein [Elusimicrobiales bacterium]|nr:type IV toxin-antitoxin system AbiEi family antitoxin domain-containing protein [Elusimicrobiales bacterium]
MTNSRHSHKDTFEHLYKIAEVQGGYFTTKQAEAAGFSQKNHGYHVRTGNWIRERRGIYRLAKFPPAERPDLIFWWLWSRNRDDVPQGVYSHETALSLYDLSDINPARLHMTVPRSFQRRRTLSKTPILHRANIHKDDIGRRFGVKVTRPLKTIADLLSTRTVQLDHMQQAVKQAFRLGLITRTELARNRRVPPAIKKEIEQLRGDQ